MALNLIGTDALGVSNPLERACASAPLLSQGVESNTGDARVHVRLEIETDTHVHESMVRSSRAIG